MTRLSVFFLALSICLVLQGARELQDPLIDTGIWGRQVHYVLAGDSRQYALTTTDSAYGHPGGPVVIGGVIASLLRLPAAHWMDTVVVVIDSVLVALIAVLIFLLVENNLSWIAVVITLSVDRMYTFATPPSAIASVAAVLLCVFTLYIARMGSTKKTQSILVWGSIAGFVAATRIDVGITVGLPCLVFLLWSDGVSLRRFAMIGGAAITTFFLSDPYMWYMPLRHMKDVFEKIMYHYDVISPITFGPGAIIGYASLAVIAVVLGACMVLVPEAASPVPRKFFIVLAAMTVLIVAVFFSAHIQQQRYLMPVILIWETLLVLYLSAITQGRQFMQRGIMGGYIAYSAIFFFSELWMTYTLWTLR